MFATHPHPPTPSPPPLLQLRELRELAKGVTKQLPDVIQNATAKIDEYARGMISGSGVDPGVRALGGGQG